MSALGAATNAAMGAAIESRDGRFVAQASQQGQSHFTAVQNLVQGLYALDPRRAQLRLRGTIACDIASEADRALVQVCAGKLRASPTPIGVEAGTAEPPRAEPAAAAPGADPAADDPHNVTAAAHAARDAVQSSALSPMLRGEPLTRRSVAAALHWARRTRHRDPKRARSDRTVIALLIAPRGHILWAARNAAGANKTMHAEMVLLQSYAMIHGALPPGCNVYVSLSPCRMCAAALHEALPARGRVAYLREDSGRYATHTALHRSGRLVGAAPMQFGGDDVFVQPERGRSL